NAARLAAHRRLTFGAGLRSFGRSLGAIPHLVWLWRHEWSWDMLIDDLRYGVRLLVRRPAFACMALATLTLGIGATTAMFGVVRAVLVRPPPSRGRSSPVRLYGVDARRGQESIGTLSVPDVRDFDRLSTTFEAMGAHNFGGYFTLTGAGEAERVPRLLVSSGYF